MGHRCLLSTWKRSIDWTIQQIMAIKIADRIVKHAPKKNRPYIDFINQSKPWHQPVTQPKQATNHESIHPKPQQKKSITWLLSHPDPSRHDLKISFFTQQPPLRHDVQLLNYIDGLASAWTSAVFQNEFQRFIGIPKLVSNSFQLEIDGCPDLGFATKFLGSN